MQLILAWLLILGAVVTTGVVVRQRLRDPARRLRRSVRRLRGSILRALATDARPEAQRILDETERFVVGLVRAREQRTLLGEMREASHQLLGSGTAVRPADPGAALDARLREQLDRLVAELSRIATATALADDGALLALRDLAATLEDERAALRELDRELAGNRLPG